MNAELFKSALYKTKLSINSSEDFGTESAMQKGKAEGKVEEVKFKGGR